MNTSESSAASTASTANAVSPVIRVLIADDRAVVRIGVRSLLATEPGIEVVAEATNGFEAVALAAQLRPDVVLMDLVMPGLDGLEATRRIVAQQPAARVLVLTSSAGEDRVVAAIRAGASGCLLKDLGPDELIQAIRQVHRGSSSLHPSVARKLREGCRAPPSATGPRYWADHSVT